MAPTLRASGFRLRPAPPAARPAPRQRSLAAPPPRPPPPPIPRAGEKILAERSPGPLDGGTLRLGPDGGPVRHRRPLAPLRRVSLHRLDWLPDLAAAGPDGARRALRLLDDWRRVFGKVERLSPGAPSASSGGSFHLACAAKALAAEASDAEIADLTRDLVRQARHLLEIKACPERQPWSAPSPPRSPAASWPASRASG
ncbi:hypothetical protein ACRAWD_26185 [Caulobacter segnis]